MKPQTETYLKIGAGILALAILPPLGIVALQGVQWLDVLEKWQSGIGAFWGALFGLGAILIGALFNADLNRKRDAELREQEARALAAALHAEMLSALGALGNMLGVMKKSPEKKVGRPGNYEVGKDIWGLELPVFKADLPRLGILGAEMDSIVVRTAQSAQRRVRGILFNFYLANDVDENLADQIKNLETIIRDIRGCAEKLRFRAQLPPDENAAALTKAQKASEKPVKKTANADSGPKGESPGEDSSDGPPAES